MGECLIWVGRKLLMMLMLGLSMVGEGRSRRRGHIELFEDVWIFAHRSIFAGRQGLEARFATLCADLSGVHGDFLARSENRV